MPSTASLYPWPSRAEFVAALGLLIQAAVILTSRVPRVTRQPAC